MVREPRLVIVRVLSRYLDIDAGDFEAQ